MIFAVQVDALDAFEGKVTTERTPVPVLLREDSSSTPSPSTDYSQWMAQQIAHRVTSSSPSHDLLPQELMEVSGLLD